MAIHENYNLKFVNVKIEEWGGIYKEVHGVDVPGFLYSPLSIYLYRLGLHGNFDGMDETVSILDDAMNGNIGDPNIFGEMAIVNILSPTTVEIIEDNSTNVMTIPIADLKAMILEYKEFLRTPPGNY